MQYNIFQLVILKIRGKSPTEIAQILTDRLDAEEETFAGNTRFRLHGMNGKQIHRLLARMTDFVETRSGRPSRYAEYIVRGGKNGYEVEHIWADHPERHVDEFEHPADFAEHRNRIGGLLLLPKKFNASYGDKTYAEKRDHYYGQNLLAQSLHENAYSHDPGFKNFVQMSGIPFKAHPNFVSQDLEDRQTLYGKLVELIWSPSTLSDIASAGG